MADDNDVDMELLLTVVDMILAQVHQRYQYEIQNRGTQLTPCCQCCFRYQVDDFECCFLAVE